MKPLLDTLKAGTAYLEKHHVSEARLNMEHLLAHVLECRRLDLYLRFGEMLREPDLETLRQLTIKRAKGTPLQHLLGSVPFLELELITDQRALIPRPETEYLCQWLLTHLQPVPNSVLDMACGSGCIGLALAHGWQATAPTVTLADISEAALDLARMNAERSKLQNLQLLRSNLFEKITPRFDLIVSNLPYIPSAEIPTLSREVQRDPILALDGGPDGLSIVRQFLTEAPQHLSPEGSIALELGMDQPAIIAAQLQTEAWRDIRILPDLAGIERFVLAKTPIPQQ
jgi:release factor glutamine methyltransferase